MSAYHITFCRELSQLLESGIPAAQAISILQKSAPHNYSSWLKSVAASIDSGDSFDQALKGPFFKNYQLYLIQAGIESGNAVEVFTELANDLENQRKFKFKVFFGLLYPLIVYHLAAVVIALLKLFVSKQGNGFYPAPALISFVLILSPLYLSLITLKLLFFISSISPAFKLAFDHTLLMMPVLKKLIEYKNKYRFYKTFYLMYKSGLNHQRSLPMLFDSMENAVYRNQLQKINLTMRDGAGLEELFSTCKFFNPSDLARIETGELSGKLDESLDLIAKDYQTKHKNCLILCNTLLFLLLFLVIAAFMIYHIISIFQSSYLGPLNELLNE
ncbi:MAG: type II secretion system F family protein [Lentisphaeria bacterium]|nr:type II secretion system F family protein [Lentisphaeria bacterium]NQZ67943.1 type II secretion system F family protein [Lentisphaeria bacterium]